MAFGRFPFGMDGVTKENLIFALGEAVIEEGEIIYKQFMVHLQSILSSRGEDSHQRCCSTNQNFGEHSLCK